MCRKDNDDDIAVPLGVSFVSQHLTAFVSLPFITHLYPWHWSYTLILTPPSHLTAPAMPTVIRPAVAADVPQLNAIHTYYVENTISTFALVPYTLEQTSANLLAVQSTGLPYIVAVDQDSEEEEIVGYGYLSPFRSAKGGYLHTVELSLYCHPEHLSRGIGSVMMRKILEVVLHPERFESDWLGESRRGQGRVREVVACMSVDPAKEADGQGLARWYGRFGFERAGRLKRVGRKFDQW